MDEQNNLSRIRQELIELLKRRAEIEKAKQQEYLENQMNDISNNIDSGMADSSAKNMERGKVKTLSNGHSILGDNKSNNGFVSALIMALLVGFAGGAITTAIYIFINLSKITFSL